jgi:hypothetical protein
MLNASGTGSLVRSVMRRYRTISVLSAFVLLIATMVWLLAERPSAKPVVAIGVLSYRNGSVCVGITNVGRTTIRYNELNFDPDGWVLTQSPTGMATRGMPAGPLRPRLLMPGSNTVASIWLPPDTLRWTVAYKVRNASLRKRIESKLPGTWGSRLDVLCGRFFSDAEGPEEEIQRDFECPHNLSLHWTGSSPFGLGSMETLLGAAPGQ